MAFNIHPVHQDFTNAVTDSNYSSLSNGYQSDSKAYTNFNNAVTNSNYSSLNTSGYQYISGGTLTATGFTEGIGLVDSYSRTVTLSYVENIGLVDPFTSNPLKSEENIGLTSTYTRTVTRNFNENIGATDLDTQPTNFNENVGLSDSFTRTITKSYSENIGVTDSEDSIIYELINDIYSMKIYGLVYPFEYYTGLIKGRTYINGVNTAGASASTEPTTFSISINSAINSLVGVTSTGSGGLGDPNPIAPIVAIDGTSLIGTAPTGITNTPVYIQLSNTAFSDPPNWDQIYGYGLSLGFNGGTFDVTSSTPIASSLGEHVQIFGLDGTVTQGGAGGFVYDSGKKGYHGSGIFGTAALNKNFNLLAGISAIAQQLALNQSYQQKNNGATLLTARSLAVMIARMCGIKIIWLANDAPLTDFSLEPGMNGLNALNSLAGRVGALVRWYGNNTYIIAYPTQTIGSFTVPHPYLISAGGISGDPILDLETGIGGAVRPVLGSANQGTYIIPTYNTNPSAQGGILAVAPPVLNGRSPLITGNALIPGYPTTSVGQVGKVTKLLTSEDPALVFDLPADYLQVYAQLLIPPGASTSSGNKFITNNPLDWFSYDRTLAGSVSPVTQVFIGNAYVPQVIVDYTVFPNNASVQAGNFVFSLACTRRNSLNNLFNSNNKTPKQSVRNFPQFIKVFQGTINCRFFGVIPIPGMYASCTLEDKTVAGIIESVSLSNPGLLQISVAEYKTVYWIQPWSGVQNPIAPVPIVPRF